MAHDSHSTCVENDNMICVRRMCWQPWYFVEVFVRLTDTAIFVKTENHSMLVSGAVSHANILPKLACIVVVYANLVLTFL
jgi:hypothetical protein